jgi:RNA polymerase sigma-70 factor (ECF subfamily)
VVQERPVAGRGPPDELEAWVLETAPRAVAYARSLLRNPDEAEDVVQDCYCRLLAKADVYDLPRDGLRLLLKAVTNACINLRTRRRTLFRLVRTDTDGVDQTDDPADDRAEPPDQQLLTRELSDAVADGLRRLPPQQRAALELKSLGHTQQEIADILDVTPTNAGVLVHRARQALARHLAPFLGGEAVT